MGGPAAAAGAADAGDFRKLLDRATKVTVLTGAGISAESGIPTFRGQGGLWRTWSALDLATPEAFAADPALVWEFYHYRRDIVCKASPNAAHLALAALQMRCKAHGKSFTLLTQNIDGLHAQAGSTDVVELHGCLWKTRCTDCGEILENRDMPICPALAGRGAPHQQALDAQIELPDLPRCTRQLQDSRRQCRGLLRPHVVWFRENLDDMVSERAYEAARQSDIFIIVGTSAVVQPAAGYAKVAYMGGATLAEFNIEDTPISSSCQYTFRGPSADVLPEILGLPA
eukprot:SM000035S13053  [mRNA]  locus=s35:126889:129061:+ [translate_table: standard]